MCDDFVHLHTEKITWNNYGQGGKWEDDSLNGNFGRIKDELNTWQNSHIERNGILEETAYWKNRVQVGVRELEHVEC